MAVKITNLTWKSANPINTPSKHFVGSRNPFLFVFVLIWHFNSISSHLNSISSSQLHWEDAPTALWAYNSSRTLLNSVTPSSSWYFFFLFFFTSVAPDSDSVKKNVGWEHAWLIKWRQCNGSITNNHLDKINVTDLHTPIWKK